MIDCNDQTNNAYCTTMILIAEMCWMRFDLLQRSTVVAFSKENIKKTCRNQLNLFKISTKIDK